MKSISVFLNAEGRTASPEEEGVIRIYTQDPAAGSWEVTEEFEFSLVKSTSISELRNVLLNMIQKIGNCRIFAAREVIGQLYSVLEANGFNIYEAEGRPEQFLASILALEEEENKKSVEKSRQPSFISPEKTDAEGTYFIDLKAALLTDPNLTSKKILLPFIASKNFKVLEVLCGHVPKWFNAEFQKQGLLSTVSKLDENVYKVIISVK